MAELSLLDLPEHAITVGSTVNPSRHASGPIADPDYRAYLDNPRDISSLPDQAVLLPRPAARAQLTLYQHQTAYPNLPATGYLLNTLKVVLLYTTTSQLSSLQAAASLPAELSNPNLYHPLSFLSQLLY